MAEKISIDNVIDFLASELLMVPEDLTEEEKNRFQYESTKNEFIKNAIDCLYDCKAKLKPKEGIISDKISINKVIGFLEGELYTIPEGLTEEEEEKWLFEIGINDAIENAIEWLEDYETKNDIEWLEDCETKWESSEDSKADALKNKDANSFKEITEEMLTLYLLENESYNNRFSEQFNEYGLTSSCIRLEDELREIKSMNKQLENREKANVDYRSIRDSLVDLANYAILTVIELDRETNTPKDKYANIFEEITEEMFALYLLKNKNYGNSFSEQFSEYGLTSSCIRLEDKLRRIKTINKQLENREKTNTDDESIRDSLVDLANYSILTVIELDREGK